MKQETITETSVNGGSTEVTLLAARQRGTVTFWNQAFRYGFLTTPPGYDREPLVSYSNCDYREGVGHDLKPGEVVEYDLVPGNKPGRLKAINVSVIPAIHHQPSSINQS